jgi:hypothetical protein
MEGLTEGRIVHYVMDRGRNQGEHRPAIVVRVWRVNGEAQANGLCQLQVFTDGLNDGGDLSSGLFWSTSVEYSEPSENKPRTWHWIERA